LLTDAADIVSAFVPTLIGRSPARLLLHYYIVCYTAPQDLLTDAADIVSASVPTLSREIPGLLDDWAAVEQAAAATSTTTGRAKAAAAAAAAAADAVALQQQMRLVRPAVRPQVRVGDVSCSWPSGVKPASWSQSTLCTW
jgi:hypothetical protein